MFKDSIAAFALLLHKQFTHHLSRLFSRNPMSVVLSSSNKVCESYGALLRRQCNLYTKSVEIINAESGKFVKLFDMYISAEGSSYLTQK